MTRIALYKAAGSEGRWKWIDRAIDFFSGRHGYSHAELVIDNVWFSSTTRDESFDVKMKPKPNGTRAKAIVPDPAKWTFIELPQVAREHELAMTEWFNTPDVLNARYDWPGVLRFVRLSLGETPTRYFCSELVIAMLQRAGMFAGENPWRWSPNSIARHFGV